MLARIVSLLVDSIATFLVFLLLARFHFQWLRVPFRNQLGEFMIATTNWIVKPARRVVPGLGGLDLATLLAAWLLQALAWWILESIAGRSPGIVALLATAFVDLLRYSLYILIITVVLQAVLSWVNPYTSIAPALDAATRPFLRPIRRFVPPVANFDLTPAVLVLLVLALLIAIGDLRTAVSAL